MINEREDYLNITYSEDGDIAKVTDYTHFHYMEESRNLEEKVKILNIGKLGYWYQLKLAEPPQLLQQGLATIFSTLEDSIVNTVYAQGMFAQFLSTP